MIKLPSISKRIWFLAYLGLGLIVFLSIYFAVLPTYLSPGSRVWSAGFGYPALLRKLGRPIPVEVARATQGTLIKTISATGAVRHLNEVPVNVEVPGIITKIKVSDGDRVRAGEVLLTLDTGGYESRVAQLDVELMQASYDRSKQDYEREKDAYEKGLIALTALQDYQRRYEEARIALMKARETFEKSGRSLSVNAIPNGKRAPRDKRTATEIPILAPISGTVLSRNVSIGENLVSPKNNVLLLGNELAFPAAVDQRYYGAIERGDKATIFLSAYPNRVFTGVVARLDSVVTNPQMQPRAGAQPPYTFLVWLKIDAGDIGAQHLASGMNGYCVFDYPLRQLVIPENALLRYSGQQAMVMVVDGRNAITLKKVVYSTAADGIVAIDEGLKEGEIVVLRGQIGLQEGDLVSFQ